MSKYLVYKDFFEKKIGKLRSNSFQDFCSELLKLRYPKDYIATSTIGRRGDLGIDGYIQSKKIACAIYGPHKNEVDKLNKNIISKFKSDIKTIFNNICIKSINWKITTIWFIANTAIIDNYSGIDPQMINEKEKLQENYKVDIIIIVPDDLFNIFLELNDDDKDKFIRYNPEPTFDETIDPNARAIIYIIRQIAKINFLENNNIEKLDLIDYKRKIDINNFSDYYKQLLLAARYKINLLDNIIFSNNYGISINNILDLILVKYHEVSEKNIESDIIMRELIDILFEELQLELLEFDIIIFKDNLFLLITKFFESCDIFKIMD